VLSIKEPASGCSLLWTNFLGEVFWTTYKKLTEARVKVLDNIPVRIELGRGKVWSWRIKLLNAIDKQWNNYVQGGDALILIKSFDVSFLLKESFQRHENFRLCTYVQSMYKSSFIFRNQLVYRYVELIFAPETGASWQGHSRTETFQWRCARIFL
jgi:hypothetical protein